jgi:hypothetical protein
MANWSNYKSVFLFLSLILLSWTPSSTDFTQKRWGFFAHKRINRMATFTLPPPLFAFYKERIEYLTEHAVDPDKRRYAMEGEAQCHYIDIDHYGEKPFEKVPQDWKEAVEKFSEDTLQAYGIVPWNILLMKFRLQRAFEERNIDFILKYSSDIGHYIGDAHVPLHTTENYNGQLTNQKGIHGLWESRLVELHAEDYDYFVGKAEYIPSMRTYIWTVVEASHIAVDSVLRIERELTAEFPVDKKYSYVQRGDNIYRNYSTEFARAYHENLNNMVERRLKASILSVGSVWYTAWVDAGQPDMNSLLHKEPSPEFLEELKTLQNDFIHGKHKGRICD